jgi:hypothetical protein
MREKENLRLSFSEHLPKLPFVELRRTRKTGLKNNGPAAIKEENR